MERFLLTLQGKRLIIDLGDRVLWKETKDRIFPSNPFIVLLNLKVQSRFRVTLFGALVFPLRWISLLGKHCGERF